MKLVQKSSRSQNRRVSNVRRRRQQHLLDVKVRSRRVTQHRIRRALVVLSRVVLVAGLCSAVYVGAREAAKRLFFENRDYQLKTIELQTDGTLQREQVLKVADLREGENIFSVNLGRVHDRIQQLPQVDEVQVVRKLPTEIDIRVVERKPVAWITSDKEISDPFVSDAAFLVDARGVLMREKKLLPEYLGLPLILGCSSESLEAGKVVESLEAKTALELLRLGTRSFMQMHFQIREIDLSKSYCLLVTDKNRTRVTFGLNDLETQLQRLEQFLPGHLRHNSGSSDQRHDRAPCGTADFEGNPGAFAGKDCSAAVESARQFDAHRETNSDPTAEKGLATMASNNLMIGLEIGTSKICVVVGESRPDGTVRILGVGQTPSRGVRKGEIVDFETAMKCVHEAVVDAEQKSETHAR